MPETKRNPSKQSTGQWVPAGDSLIVTTDTCPWPGVDNTDRLTIQLQIQLMSQLNDAPKPRIPDAVDFQRLQAMQIVAKMKESADKFGVGFVGGFISPNGEKFTMTNMSDEDTDMLLPEDLR